MRRSTASQLAPRWRLLHSEALAATESQLSRRPPPSERTQRLAAELIALEKDELVELRKLCRDRLVAKPSGHKGPLKKNYDPSLKIRREDRPLALRAALRDVGRRFPAMHPAFLFAGAGPGVLPAPMPPLSQAFLAPHMADLAATAPAPATVVGAPLPEADGPVGTANEEAEAAGQIQPDAEADVSKEADKPLKAVVTLRLLGFEAAKKITVIKEVRALLGEGLKESKELVERVPVTLRKGVQRADAEAQAEKLRAAGADVALE